MMSDYADLLRDPKGAVDLNREWKPSVSWKVGDALVCRALVATLVMIAPVTQHNDDGNDVESVRVLYQDRNAVFHEATLPVVILEKVS